MWNRGNQIKSNTLNYHPWIINVCWSTPPAEIGIWQVNVAWGHLWSDRRAVSLKGFSSFRRHLTGDNLRLKPHCGPGQKTTWTKLGMLKVKGHENPKKMSYGILGIYSHDIRTSYYYIGHAIFEKTRKMLMCSAWWRSETCNPTWQMRPGIINCQFVIWDPGFIETADLVLGKSTWLLYFMLEHPQSQEKKQKESL